MSYKGLIAAALLAAPVLGMATEYRIVERPRQECWNEQVPVQAGGDPGGAIIGGIAGDLLGNQVGNGNGRVVATAVGAMTGAVVGDRMSGRTVAYQPVRRCRTVMEQVREPVVYAPTPVYAPAPVYAPPVVYQRPVVVTRPVVEERVYYVEQGRPHWRHHHHDDDD